MSTVLYHKKNLVYLRVQKGLSQEQLANSLGYSRNVYKNYEYTQDPDPEFLVKISDFFDINIHDFFTKDLSHADDELLKDRIKILKMGGLRVLTVTVDEKQRENIEFVPIKAKAGYLTGYSDPVFITKLRKFSFPLPLTGTYRAFEIEGDSMPPHKKGSVIIGKYIDEPQNIKNGKTYVVVTKDDGVVYKRLYRTAPNAEELIFLSDNRSYTPYIKKLEDLIEVWEYYAHLSFDPNENLLFLNDTQTVTKIEEILNMLNKSIH